jgi:hypothetical protein
VVTVVTAGAAIAVIAGNFPFILYFAVEALTPRSGERQQADSASTEEYRSIRPWIAKPGREPGFLLSGSLPGAAPGRLYNAPEFLRLLGHSTCQDN